MFKALKRGFLVKGDSKKPCAPTYDLVEIYNPDLVSWRCSGAPVPIEVPTSLGRKVLILSYLDIPQESNRNWLPVTPKQEFSFEIGENSFTVPRDFMHPGFPAYTGKLCIDEEFEELRSRWFSKGKDRRDPIIFDLEFEWTLPVVRAGIPIENPDALFCRTLPKENIRKPEWGARDSPSARKYCRWGLPVLSKQHQNSTSPEDLDFWPDGYDESYFSDPDWTWMTDPGWDRTATDGYL